MATRSTSIADIEQQIAKVTAQLQQARAQQFAKVEKAYLAAQKAAEQARTKVRDLVAKGTGSAAAQNRLLTAQAWAEELDNKLAEAREVYDVLNEQQKASGKFAKKVDKVPVGKTSDKKATLTQKEKGVPKEKTKKLAKSGPEADKKVKKNNVTKEQAATTAPTNESKPTVKKTAVKKVADKKDSVKKPTAKKAPVKTVAVEEKETVAPSVQETDLIPGTQTASTHQAAVTNVESVESAESNLEATTPVETVSVDADGENSTQDKAQ